MIRGRKITPNIHYCVHFSSSGSDNIRLPPDEKNLSDIFFRRKPLLECILILPVCFAGVLATTRNCLNSSSEFLSQQTQPARPVTRHLCFWRAVIYDGSDRCGIRASWQCSSCFCSLWRSCRWHQIIVWIMFTLFPLWRPEEEIHWCFRGSSQRVCFSTCPTNITVSACQGHLFGYKRKKNVKTSCQEPFRGVCQCLALRQESLPIRLSLWI